MSQAKSRAALRIVLCGGCTTGGLYFIALHAITRPDSMALLLRNAVFITAMLLAIRVGVASDRLLQRVKIGKFIVWAAVFGIAYLASIGLLGVLSGKLPRFADLGLVAQIGVLTGAGAGLGCELTELVAKRFVHPGGQTHRNP